MSDYSAVGPPQQNYNQSSAFAAALQRAKQIAAKINPGTTSVPEPRTKRPLEEGQEPDAKKPPQNLGPPPQQHSPLGAPPPISSRPPSHQNSMGGPAPGMGGTVNEDIKVPDKMVGLIIGRGGEQITRLQSESGCKIQMAPDSQGMNERVCSLSGTKDAVNRAKELIMNIVHQRGRTEGLEPNDGPPMGAHNNYSGMNQGMGQGGHGPHGGHGGPNHGPPMGMGGGPGGRNFVEIMIPGPKVGLIIGKGGETIKQLQEKSGAKMVVIQEGPNQEQEKPLRITGDTQKVEYAKQLVYELIAEKEIQSFNRRGGGGRGPPNDDRQQGGFNDYGGGQGGNGAEVLVPRAAVGVVIGKGGDMIKKIQAETGARVQFQQAREEGPGERTCFLQGNPKQVEQARQRIEELIDSVQRRDEGGPQQSMRGGPGRGGGGGGRFDNRNNRNGNGDFGGGGGGGGWNDRQPQNSQQEVSFVVPSLKCGVIIGRGGETIKQINQQSGAHCELDRRAQNPNPNDKTFVIRGDPDQIESAKRIIQDKVQIRLNFTVTSGGGGGGPPPMANNIPTAYPGMTPQGYNPQGWGMPTGYPQQQQQQAPQQQWGAPTGQALDQSGQGAQNVTMNPSTGQPDYSIQWAEYYRSLGMHREAELIEQNAKNKGVNATAGVGAPVAAAPGVPAAAAPTAASAANGQADFSAQWAEYYRSIGRVKDAEAIEAQLKNKGGQPVVPTQSATPAAAPQAPAGTYQQQPYGAYTQPAGAGYYGAQPQSAVPGGVSQTAGYSYPSYGYGAPAPGAAPSSQDN